MLVCSDGLLPAHKLVLAALSPLLRSALAEADTWDQEENNISIIMPDFSTQQLSRYLADIWTCEDLGHHPDVNIVLGHIVHKQSENNYEENGQEIDGRRSTLLTDFVKEEPMDEEKNVHKFSLGGVLVYATCMADS